MWIRRLYFCLFLTIPVAGQAQAGQGASSPDQGQAIDEITVTGNRSLWQLHSHMIDTERRAYDVFNRFNDDKRFRISCSTQVRTGTHFSRQVCQPEFEIQAAKGHAQDFLESMGTGNFIATHPSMEFEILRQQAAFKRKMKQVAEQHPEFLAVLKEYSEARRQYERGTGGGENVANDGRNE